MNCKNEYDNSRIYGVNELPECETSLPDLLEISRYPYLSGVEIYALERQRVDMLIGAEFAGLMVPTD